MKRFQISKIKKFVLCLSTTLILLFLNSFNTIKADNKTREKRIDSDPIEYTMPNQIQKDQFLDKYNLTIEQVIVKGEDLSSVMSSLDSNSKYQDTFLKHVDSLYTDFKNTFLALEYLESEKEILNKTKQNEAQIITYSIILGILVVSIGILIISIVVDNKRFISLFTYIFLIDLAIVLLKLQDIVLNYF